LVTTLTLKNSLYIIPVREENKVGEKVEDEAQTNPGRFPGERNQFRIFS